MARKRMLDPKIWESEQVMSLPSDAFKLYIYCINHADDDGRLSISYAMIKSRCFPIANKITIDAIETHLNEMAESGLIWLYSVDDFLYLAHPNWDAYQTISHRTKSKLPPPPEDSRSPTGGLPCKLIKDKLIKDKLIKDKLIKDNIYKEANPCKNPDNQPEKIEYAEAVHMTDKEYTTLIHRYGDFMTRKMIDKLNNYKLSKKGGKTKYASDYRAILTWVVESVDATELKSAKEPDKRQAEINRLKQIMTGRGDNGNGSTKKIIGIT